MNWKALINLIVSSAMSGAITGLLSGSDKVGRAVGVGASVSVISHLRQRPDLWSMPDEEGK